MSLPIDNWWQYGVIYQIYPRSFQDANGDGIGDLEGIIARLDHLNDGTPASLGVDVIWICPFYPSPMVDFGYDVVDYTDIDPMFGDLATFDRLVEEAHRRDVRVVIDFVPSHSSDQHPWFVESRSSRDNPRRDWYLWHDPAPGGGPPNNWLAVFGGPAWELDERTGQYYLHSFLKEQPDLNWRNPEVVEAMHEVMRFWLDRGVDGFRIDAVHYLLKDALWRDNPPATEPPEGGKSFGPFDQFEHLYDLDQPDVHGVVRGLRQVVDEYPGRVAIGETYLFDLEQLIRYYGSELDGLHLPLNIRTLHVPWEAAAFRTSVDEYEAALPHGAWPNYVLGSHDEHRVASRFGPDQAHVAAMLLLTLRGTPTIYYGEELGMLDVDIPPELIQDPFGVQVPGFDLGRDPCRTPMPWDEGPNAGFTSGSPWLPLGPDYPERSVAAQRDDPASTFSLYRRLIWTRKESPALHKGTYTPLDGVPETCFAYLRQSDDQRMLVALNFGDAPLNLSLGELGEEVQLRLSTYLDQPSVALDAMRLRPNEGLLLELV